MESSVAAAMDPENPEGFDLTLAYREHAPFIARVIRSMLGEGPHVDDILQETFIIALRKSANFAGRSALSTWLYGIASRLCHRHRRGVRRFSVFLGKLSREPGLIAGESSDLPDRRLARQESVAGVRNAILKLPFKQREVFVLYEIEGLEGKHIADLLNLPLGTVWRRLHEARGNLETRLRKHAKEQP